MDAVRTGRRVDTSDFQITLRSLSTLDDLLFITAPINQVSSYTNVIIVLLLFTHILHICTYYDLLCIIFEELCD